MLPWKNSWFQIAFFAWLISGALLMVNYAPKMSSIDSWIKAVQQAHNQAPQRPSTPTLRTEQEAPEKQPGLKPPNPSQSPAQPAMKEPNTPRTAPGSAELAKGNAARDAKDYATAMQWYQKAAAQGNAEAENRLAAMYENGSGVQLDYAAAMKWYRKAAAQGNAGAEFKLGFLYKFGLGVQQNNAEAMKWLQKAAAKGNTDAAQFLARLQAN